VGILGVDAVVAVEDGEVAEPDRRVGEREERAASTVEDRLGHAGPLDRHVDAVAHGDERKDAGGDHDHVPRLGRIEGGVHGRVAGGHVALDGE
jgi:hypothetical protein